MSVRLRFTVEPGAQLPSRAYADDAGVDLATSIEVMVPPRVIMDIPTGLAMATPTSCWAWVVGRSSALRRWGLAVHGGIIDPGYRGPLFIQAENKTDEPIVVPAGTRLAQVILMASIVVPVVQVDALPPAERGANGFGSSGR